jgi:hypothetical protein
LLRGVGSTVKPRFGEMNSGPVANGRQTLSRATFRTIIHMLMATSARLLSARSRQTAMVCMTWPATSGSGSQTGIATTTTHNCHEADCRGTRRGQTTASIHKSPECRSVCRRAGPFFVAISIANATCRAPEEREIPKPPRTTLDFVV